MKLLITGASGFLGQYVVAEALRRGHEVHAVIRSAVNEEYLPWHTHPLVKLVRLDLRQRSGLVEAAQEVDAVLHLAAAKAGDFYTQFAGTVITTENLLDAMVQANTLRLIAISTFSVFDYLQLSSGQVLDEDSPLEDEPLQRDDYAQTKLIQEELYRDFEQSHNGKVTILRPGMIYGRDNLWNACLGAELSSNAWLLIGSQAIMPLTYVENCASAILNAVERDEAIGQTINIVDDDLPTQKVYTKELIKRMDQPPKTLSVSWTVMQLLANSLWTYNQKFLQGRAKFPGIFVPAKLHARFKSLRYSNNRAKQVLDWTPQFSLTEALDRSCSSANLLDCSVIPVSYASSVV